MISKKIRALSAVMAAALMFGGVPAGAYEHIKDLPTDYVEYVRLNKPYMNFGVKAGEDVDITDMKFAIKDKNGKKIATFKGGSDSLTVLDDSLFDLTNIHSNDDLKKYDRRLAIPYDPYVSDKEKSTSPNTLYLNDDYEFVGDGNFYIRPYDECYYYFADPKKVKVTETMTLPANTGFVEIDSKYAERDISIDSIGLSSEKGLKCGLEQDDSGKYRFHDHAGTRTKFKADAGSYDMSTGPYSWVDHLDIYDHPVSYSKVRIKFTEAFPGLADSDLKIKKDYKLSTGEEYSIVYNVRGDDSKNYFSVVYYSGSVVTSVFPDKDGYIEVWVQDDLKRADMCYILQHNFEINGRSGSGSGGGYESLEMPKSIEDIVFPFEYPQAGFCLYNLDPGDYKIVIDDKGDSRDYRLNRDILTVTDTKDIQRYSITVNKRPLLLGDCNRDGTIDVTDIAIIAAHVKGIKMLDGRGPLTADVDESDWINTTDISKIAAHVKGKKLIPEKWI